MEDSELIALELLNAGSSLSKAEGTGYAIAGKEVLVYSQSGYERTIPIHQYLYEREEANKRAKRDMGMLNYLIKEHFKK